MAKAEKGDLIRIVKIEDQQGDYKVGDILEVAYVDEYSDDDDVTVTTNQCYLIDNEYEIHRKAGEEDSTECTVIEGVGPNADIVENENGAKQSHLPYRMDLIDAKALLKIAQVHKQGGDKYGDTNWHGISINDHINHALVHVYAHLADDDSDEHLAHAATRLIFALALHLRTQY